MAGQEKLKTLKKCIDVAAALAILYPLFILLWTQHQHVQGPAAFDTKFLIKSGAMFLTIPAVCWLAWRQMSSPLGTHPILDRLMKDRRLRLGIIAVLIVLFILLSKLIDHTKE